MISGTLNTINVSVNVLLFINLIAIYLMLYLHKKDAI